MVFCLVGLLLLAGCASKVADVKSEDNIGRTVTVKGVVEGSVKIGALSGYRLVDSAGDSILVSSERLPADGDVVRVKGVLMRDSLLGYYVRVVD